MKIVVIQCDDSVELSALAPDTPVVISGESISIAGSLLTCFPLADPSINGVYTISGPMP